MQYYILNLYLLYNIETLYINEQIIGISYNHFFHIKQRIIQ
ncbi:hypothetical protein pb186bvf_011289 [Paramecium bursaria]